MVNIVYADSVAAEYGPRVVAFLQSTDSFKTVLSDIADLGYHTVHIRETNRAGPGYVELSPNTDPIVYIDFDTRYMAVGQGRFSSVEEIVYHEFSHIALGHLEGGTGAEGESEALHYTNNTLRDEIGLPHRFNHEIAKVRSGATYLNQECFGAGTPIDMWPLDPLLKPGPDGVYDQAAVQAGIWRKPIEEVAVKDFVVSFDKNGNMVPGFVPRTMTNVSKIILDFHSTWVTPGHVYFCAGGEYEGKYAPLIDILRTDGVVQMQDGIKIRASTGCEVGSLEDTQITVAPLVNGQADITQARKIRLGTRLVFQDATEATILEGLAGTLGPVNKDGMLANGQHVSQVSIAWHFGVPIPNPEDYVLIRSQTSLDEIYQANQWEGMPSQMPAPMIMDGGAVQPLPADKIDEMPRNMPMAMKGLGAGGSPMAQRNLSGPGGRAGLNRKARKAMEAKQRKAAKVRARVATH